LSRRLAPSELIDVRLYFLLETLPGSDFDASWTEKTYISCFLRLCFADDDEVEYDDEGNEIVKKLDRKRKRADDDDTAQAKRRKQNASGAPSTHGNSKSQQQKRTRAGYANEENISSAEMETQLWRCVLELGFSGKVRILIFSGIELCVVREPRLQY
jgi:hypothetical protein